MDSSSEVEKYNEEPYTTQKILKNGISKGEILLHHVKAGGP